MSHMTIISADIQRQLKAGKSVEIDTYKKVARGIAGLLVTRAIKEKKTPVSDTERDRLVEAETTKIIVHIKEFPDQLGSLMEEYLHAINSEPLELDNEFIIDEKTLKLLGATTESGAMRKDAAKMSSAWMKKASKKNTVTQMGIKIAPSSAKSSGVFGKMFDVVTGNSTFDPNKDKRSSTYGSAELLDRGAFKKDESYRQAMTLMAKEIQNSGAKATKEQLGLLKEIRKQEAELKFKSRDAMRERMSGPERALFDATSALSSGLLKVGSDLFKVGKWGFGKAKDAVVAGRENRKAETEPVEAPVPEPTKEEKTEEPRKTASEIEKESGLPSGIIKRDAEGYPAQLVKDVSEGVKTAMLEAINDADEDEGVATWEFPTIEPANEDNFVTEPHLSLVPPKDVNADNAKIESLDAEQDAQREKMVELAEATIESINQVDEDVKKIGERDGESGGFLSKIGELMTAGLTRLVGSGLASMAASVLANPVFLAAAGAFIGGSLIGKLIYNTFEEEIGNFIDVVTGKSKEDAAAAIAEANRMAEVNRPATAKVAIEEETVKVGKVEKEIEEIQNKRDTVKSSMIEIYKKSGKSEEEATSMADKGIIGFDKQIEALEQKKAGFLKTIEAHQAVIDKRNAEIEARRAEREAQVEPNKNTSGNKVEQKTAEARQAQEKKIAENNKPQVVVAQTTNQNVVGGGNEKTASSSPRGGVMPFTPANLAMQRMNYALPIG